MDEQKHEEHHAFLEEHREFLATWVEREKQRIAFRRSIIEKTLASLIWTSIAGGCTLLWHFLKEHWKW